MAFPGKHIKQEYLSEKDKEDLLFAIDNDLDFIACSFVSVKKDLEAVHEFLDANGGNGISLIAKIENQSGYDNIEDICELCSGIMVARGDMGVEIPYERLPAIQKDLITKCRLLGRRVITATEMLESMINNPRPTRAEASDVANAVYDVRQQQDIILFRPLKLCLRLQRTQSRISTIERDFTVATSSSKMSLMQSHTLPAVWL